MYAIIGLIVFCLTLLFVILGTAPFEDEPPDYNDRAQPDKQDYQARQVEVHTRPGKA